MPVFATPFAKDHGKSTIKVYIRTRHLLEKEILEGSHNILSVSSVDKQVLVEDGTKGTFTYDGVCDEGASQEEVFEMVLSPLLKHIIDGHCVTVIAYGQTGSGKTYTMGMSPRYSEDEGLLKRALKALFDLTATKEESPFLKLSFLEVYNESVYDLFSSRKSISTKPDGFGGVIPDNCKEETVFKIEECLELIQKGNNLRMVASTAMNSHSSRSHALISMALYKKQNGIDVVRGRLRLVDLAGAEGVGRNNMEGKGFDEGVSINKGLLAVGKVLAALSNGTSSSHVPYRESIVTRLLRDALGGNCYTAMITCISPASTNLAMTLNTLRYAEQARNIKKKVTAFSSVKSKGIKRTSEDVSATPSAWKKIVYGKERPSHNSTISTPGHKPPVDKCQPFNNTFATPLDRASNFMRCYPRSSSRTDLTGNGPLQQPVFEEDSPTQSIIGVPRVDTSILQISPLVERVNSRLEQSIMQYEQRMQDQFRGLEDRLARRVAKLLVKGKQTQRRSKRVQQVQEESKHAVGLTSTKSKICKGEELLGKISEDLKDSFTESPSDLLSLPDSIADALLKRQTFHRALQGAVKLEQENVFKNACVELKENHLSQTVRSPLRERTNLNQTDWQNESMRFSSGHFPSVTSTVGCLGKVVRRSNRLSSRLLCPISPLVGVHTPSFPRSQRSTEKTIIYGSEPSPADLEETVIYQKATGASPDLPQTTLLDKVSLESSQGALKEQANTKSHKITADQTLKESSERSIRKVRQVKITYTGSPSKLPNKLARRQSSRRCASIETQRNFDLLNAIESPLRRRSLRISTRTPAKSPARVVIKACRAYPGLEPKWEFVIRPTLRKSHEEAILSTLNTGSLRELQKLPTVGPKTAMVIFNFRKLYGNLKKVEDIKKIPGVQKSYHTRFMKANLIGQINLK